MQYFILHLICCNRLPRKCKSVNQIRERQVIRSVRQIAQPLFYSVYQTELRWNWTEIQLSPMVRAASFSTYKLLPGSRHCQQQVRMMIYIRMVCLPLRYFQRALNNCNSYPHLPIHLYLSQHVSTQTKPKCKGSNYECVCIS